MKINTMLILNALTLLATLVSAEGPPTSFKDRFCATQSLHPTKNGKGGTGKGGKKSTSGDADPQCTEILVASQIGRGRPVENILNPCDGTVIGQVYLVNTGNFTSGRLDANLAFNNGILAIPPISIEIDAVSNPNIQAYLQSLFTTCAAKGTSLTVPKNSLALIAPEFFIVETPPGFVGVIVNIEPGVFYLISCVELTLESINPEIANFIVAFLSGGELCLAEDDDMMMASGGKKRRF